MKPYQREDRTHHKPKVPIPPQPQEKPLPPLEQQHPLRDSWALSFAPPRARDVNNYEQSMVDLTTFNTVEQFWSIYSHIKRPSKVDLGTDFYLFKEGIKPMWEDPANEKGGRITFRLAKHRSSKAWEELVLGAIGGKLQPSDEICGLVIGVRYISPNKMHLQQPTGEDVLAIWTRDASNIEARQQLIDTIKKLLKLHDHVILDYKEHDSARKKAIEVTNAQHQKQLHQQQQAPVTTTEGEESQQQQPATETKQTEGDNFW